MRWLFSPLIVLDKVANFLSGGKEWETISSRMGKALIDPNSTEPGKSISIALCSLLDKISKDHCVMAIEVEMTEHGIVMMKNLGLQPRTEG